MIFQGFDLDYTWIICAGILIGLSLFLTFLTDGKDVKIITIFVYMTIINGFVVSAGIFPLWSEVIFLLILVGMTILKNKRIS